MTLINSPTKSIPVSAALGGQSLRQIDGAARSNQVMPSPDIMVSRTTSGTFLKLRNPVEGGGGVNVTEFRIPQDLDKPSRAYIEVYSLATWPRIQTTPPTSGALEKILLPKYLSNALQPATAARIHPIYKQGDIIYCVDLPTTGPAGEKYLDLNVDARRWSIGVTICQNEVTEKFWIPVERV